MNIPQPVDFLSQVGPDRLRKEIQNICDSYSHPWDLLSELCQNAVDAISIHRKRYGESNKKHSISITLNCLERSVEITDSGAGFCLNKFEQLLAPHGTDKLPTDPVIGQKGVGLTYTIFISNSYTIETASIDGSIKGTIKNASAWKNASINKIPVFEPESIEKVPNDPQKTFTRVTVKDIERLYDDNEDLFTQSFPILRLLLRTKTAVGYLKKVFKENNGLNIPVILKQVTPDGKTIEEVLNPEYLLPEELIPASRVVDLDDFKQQAATYDDAQKAKKLQGKCLRKIGSVQRANKKINFYCFFGSRNLWGEISTRNQLTFKNSSGEEVNLFEGGIYTASRGMPTGIRLEAPRTGNYSYWPAFYIILEDDSITFDLGRKAIPGRTSGLLREIAKTLFNEFVPFFSYVSSDPPVGTIASVQQYEKNKYFEELRKLPDLNLPKINYLKHPDSQEAAVVALFHELVGAKILEGYYSLKTGYKMTYDLWGIYRIDKAKVGANCWKYANSGIIELSIVIEFKDRGEAILEDFESDRKFFTDIDIIVCWDFDEVAFSKQSVAVEQVPKDDVLFYGTNFKFVWPGSYNLGNASTKPVIALRRLIQDLQQK